MVAICGRPNVGKSSLFNILAKSRIAIVDPTPGVTRDRISTYVRIDDKCFELVDTGGIGIEKESQFGEAIFHQVQIALEKADIILFMVDIMEGLNALDVTVADMLRKYKDEKTIWVLANKTDHVGLLKEQDQFYRLGFGEPLCVSAAHRQGIGELKEKLYERLPVSTTTPPEDVEIKIAVVGRTNVGKSTFINALAHEERMIVSEIPGTTRDSVDVYFEKDGKTLIAIDTAGLRRGKNVQNSIDFYSQARAQRAIRRADVVVFMIDAAVEISKIDKQIAEMVRDECKPAILVINKWDLAKGQSTPDKYEKYLSSMMPDLAYAPMSFITAKTGKNVAATIDLAKNLHKRAHTHISTGELNRVIKQVTSKKGPPYVRGKQGKIYYATQGEVVPPTFVLFVNYPHLFDDKYQRYMFRELQQRLGLNEVPIKLIFRERERMARAKDKDEKKEAVKTASKSPIEPFDEEPLATTDGNGGENEE